MGGRLLRHCPGVLPVFDIPISVVRLIVLLESYWDFRSRSYFPGSSILRDTELFERLTLTLATSTPFDLYAISVENYPANPSPLPFNDLSLSKDHAYFGEGIAEELLGALAKVDGLRVAARRSSFWFKDKEAQLGEIASKLNVGHRCSRAVSVGLTAIECESPRNSLMQASGVKFWSETYESVKCTEFLRYRMRSLIPSSII